ncbi:MAG: hypothetical protein E7A62_08685 [Actinomycetaceae bacterium]|nr:hypothetical protein [Actinomycetaceae bacterium]MDU0971050.1 hypothetical protein [Actinomycetaceae bacterium]
MRRIHLPNLRDDEHEVARPLHRFVKWLVAIAYPLFAIAAICGVALLGLWGWSLTSVHAATDRHFGRAVAGFTDQRDLTRHWPEPWRSPYNLGTARLEGGRTDEGVRFLRQAFDLVPKEKPIDKDKHISPTSPECMVRLNLSVGIEHQGDAQRRAGNETQATSLFNEAATMSQPCTQAGQSSGDEDQDKSQKDSAKQGKQANDRQNQKAGNDTSKGQDASQSPGQGDSQSSSGGSGGDQQQGQQGSSDEEERKRQEQLDKRNQDARERATSQPDQGPTLPKSHYW